MTDDWFRTADWDADSQQDFAQRLARARPRSRSQYLRIKASAVRDGGNESAARELFERAAAQPGAPLFEVVAAWEALADLAVRNRELTTAERLYRRILADQPTLSGTSGDIEISLVEVLLDRGGRERRDEAAALLGRWRERDGMKFDDGLFRWNLALIRIAEAMGDTETVTRAASTALTLAERGPQLPRHRDVGLVRTDRATLRRLRRLAGR